jgi:hypothetical protein
MKRAIDSATAVLCLLLCGKPDLSPVGIKTFLQTGVSCPTLCYTGIRVVHGRKEKLGPRAQVCWQSDETWCVICLPSCTISRVPFGSFAGS